jgi:hypothetical protein
MTPSARHDTVNPSAALKLGNRPGELLQGKIGKSQHDSNQAIAAPRG